MSMEFRRLSKKLFSGVLARSIAKIVKIYTEHACRSFISSMCAVTYRKYIMESSTVGISGM